jgi:hypothetical protein
VKEGDVIEGLDDFFLHLVDRRRAPCHAEMKLCCAPILFNEVEFAVILGVKITQMPARLDQLLKLGLLKDEIGLHKKYASAATVHAARGATKARALGKKDRVALGPQPALPNDSLHALEPAGHGRVVFREIEWLGFAVWECAVAHAWTVRMVRPLFLRSCKRSQSVCLIQ